MASGDPNDIFDAAENFGKVFTKLAEGALAPKKILPTYKMLVDDAKPPIPSAEKELAAYVAEHPKTWDALLKRPFHTLKADGPFIFDAGRSRRPGHRPARLAGRPAHDPPSLSLVRFRLEGIDTAWRVISARRVLPGDDPEDSSPERVATSPSGAPPRRTASTRAPWAIPRHR